jgi:hypothetical protein
MFPVEEVCGDKGLIDKYPSSSLCLAFLIIIHGALDFPQEHMQGSRSLRRGGGPHRDALNQVCDVG